MKRAWRTMGWLLMLGVVMGVILSPGYAEDYSGEDTKYVPEVRDLIVTHYLNYRLTLGPLDLSRLLTLGTPSTTQV